MSHDAVAILVGIAVGAGLVLSAQFMGTLNQRISNLKAIQEGIEEILSRPAVATGWTDVDEEDHEQALEDLTPPEIEPIPVDPSNPPRTVTYNPRDPNKAAPPCNCHGEPIEPGDEVVHWPLPNNQGILLFHASWLHAQGMSPAGVR